eukprot:gene9253-10216_t
MGGANSKSTFARLVKSLSEKDIDGVDHEFWDELWRTVLTPQEIFEIISPDDVRMLIEQRPTNIKTVFTQAVAQLYQLVETPYPVYFEQALNCMRVLARILPFLLETDSKVIWELLWNKRIVNSTQPAASDEAEAKQMTSGREMQESEPLAVILVNTLFHLMFLPDLTVEDPNEEFTEGDVETPAFKAALMWAPGVGSVEKTVVSSTQFDANRIDVLRLMIACFSDSLYQSSERYDPCASMWLEVATSVDAPYAEIVFYSLMNTVLGYDPVGWGIPYGNLIATDSAKHVMEHAIQALIILLDYGHPIRHDATITPNLPYVDVHDTQAQGFNIFRKYLGQIEAPDQLNFIYRGFVRLLNNVHEAEASYLPHSVTRITIEQELLVLFWKCLEEIPKFLPYILKHCDVTEMVVPICYLMLAGRKDPAKIGLLYLCTFTLLKLSGERNFGVALNKHYQLRLPVDVPLFSGNHADLLVIVLHKMIVSGIDKLSALYSCFLTIICNISPYCKSLCSVAAVKLVNLFQLFVSPHFLYASSGNHVYIGLLLETFNNIVQYQFEGNGNLIFAIIRKKELFEGLAGLTLPVAIKTARERDHHKSPTTSSQNHKQDANLKVKVEEKSLVPPDVQPTSFISTQHVERRLNNEGEVLEVHTAEADARTPMTPNGTMSTVEEEESKSPVANGAPDAPSRFVPTEAWLASVKADLPLNTIMRLLKNIVPQIEELSQKQVVDEKLVVDFLRSTTMVGLLPVPHPIVIRKYQPNRFTCLWFTAFLWGVIFTHNQTVPLFDGKKVKLFVVQQV